MSELGRKLLIVQDVPTQFDVPLYAKIHAERPFDLKVYYTRLSDADETREDPELGFAPQWDHLEGHEYDRAVRPLFGVLAVFRLAREIAAEAPDLVIVSGYMPWPHALLAVLLQQRGIRTGLRSDSTQEHATSRGLRRRLKTWILRWLLPRYAIWHPVGEAARKNLEVLAGDARPSVAFPYLVDEPWFQQQIRQEGPASSREALDIPRDAWVVLGIMKWSDREDPLTLAHAFGTVAQKMPDAHLLLVGDGPLRTAINEALGEFEGRVTLPGYLPYSALPGCYAASDVFVHPALSEPWGVSVHEALASGVPVVVSEAVGSIHELVREDAVLRFPAGDAGALARHLLSIRRRGRLSQILHGHQDYDAQISRFEAALAPRRCRKVVEVASVSGEAEESAR